MFFHINFHRLGLKKLTATHYNMDGSSSYVMTYDSQDPKDDINFNKGTKTPLKGSGDFRSPECIDLLKQSDMVVTNPPFSLFREFVAQLEQYHKKFIIWGNNNAITYKEIFPLIKEGKLWLGYLANKTCCFKLSPDYPKWDEKFTAKMNDGSHYGKVPAISTFTNIDTKKRHCKLKTAYRWHKHKEKYPDLYPKYDNYDAIEVGRVLQIPLDYDGLMTVPITFLDKYNPDQFIFVGEANHGSGGPWDLFKPLLNGKYKFKRLVIKNKHPESYQNNEQEEDKQWHKDLILHKHYLADDYLKFDNYDALNVDKIADIPLDYDGIMGVPITFLGKYNPEQFEILGITSGRKEYDKRVWPTKRYLNALQYKQDGTISNGSKVNTGPMLLVNSKPTKGVYYTANNVKGYLLRKYDRILIRNKHPEDYQNN